MPTVGFSFLATCDIIVHMMSKISNMRLQNRGAKADVLAQRRGGAEKARGKKENSFSPRSLRLRAKTFVSCAFRLASVIPFVTR